MRAAGRAGFALAGLLGAAALLSAPRAAVGAVAGLRFEETSAAAGLVHPTWCGGEEKPHILESGGTGLALVDYDGDGDLDLYLVNGWRLSGAEVAERGRNRLYRNRGDGTFEDVTERAGVGDEGWGTGISVGDADGDGLPDLFVSNFGADVLYLNRGDGTFAAAPQGPGIDGWSTGAVFFDADADGDEDLYLGAYIDCSLEDVLTAKPTLHWEGLRVMTGPFGLEGLGNRYFENTGGGSYREATEAAGLEDVGLFYTFGIAALDLDGDLDLDLYVANDSNPNYVYRNDGGQFEEVGLWSGAALDGMGNAQAGMGLAAEDVDGDGNIDIFVTNFYKDVSSLYRNLGDFVFDDVTQVLGLSGPTYQPLSWGAELADLDLDGNFDLFIANGHIYPQADLAPDAGTSFRQVNLLFRGEPGAFHEVGGDAGPGLAARESSRGVATGDVDGDGDLDFAISNVDAPPHLLRNDSERRGVWLMVDAPAALRVRVEVGARGFDRNRVVGASFLSAGDARFHFGLGTTKRVDRLLVTDARGRRTLFHDLPAKRVLVLPPSLDRGSSPR